METKYLVGLGIVAVVGVGLYAYLNNPRATAPIGPPGSMDVRDTSGAAVDSVGSPNASTAANDAAVVIGALGAFAQRGVDAALRIRQATQQPAPQTSGGVSSTGATGVYRAGGGGDRKDF